MIIPSAWPHILDFFGTPLVLELIVWHGYYDHTKQSRHP